MCLKTERIGIERKTRNLQHFAIVFFTTSFLQTSQYRAGCRLSPQPRRPSYVTYSTRSLTMSPSLSARMPMPRWMSWNVTILDRYVSTHGRVILSREICGSDSSRDSRQCDLRCETSKAFNKLFVCPRLTDPVN